jgi:hypothetical protein
MPTNFSSGIQRSLTVFLVALLVLPPGESLAFARKKKKADLAAASESQLTQDQRVLQALNRLTFGPRPGDVAAVEAMGLDKWINEQLNPETMDDSALEARLAAYPAMRLSRHDLIERFPSPATMRQSRRSHRSRSWNPVERAIFQDQIAQLRDRQENKAATPGTGYRLQVTGYGEGRRADSGRRDEGDGRRYGSATARYDAGERCGKAGGATDRGAGKEAVCGSGCDERGESAAG